MPGLLIDGVSVPVPGVEVINTQDAAWAHLSPGDGIARSNWPSKIVIHKTKGDDPEYVLPGAGPTGRPERVAKFWQDDPRHSGAHLVVGGEAIACLADLVRFEAWHANQANHQSVGIEHYEERGAFVFQQVLDNGILLIRTLVEALGIQLQVPRLPYSGRPLWRFADGGHSLVGIFGHRDVTSARGRWDPGDQLFKLLVARLHAEEFDFDAGEDLTAWKDRQSWINTQGAYSLVVDGEPGPKTTAALKSLGYCGGIWALGRR